MTREISSDPKKAKKRYEELVERGNSQNVKEFLRSLKFDRKDYTDKERILSAELYTTKDLWEEGVLKIPNEFADENKDESGKFRVQLKAEIASETSKTYATILSKFKDIFYRISTQDVVEIVKMQDLKGDTCYQGFKTISPKRFITLSENHISPYSIKKTTDEYTEIPTSLSDQKSSIFYI